MSTRGITMSKRRSSWTPLIVSNPNPRTESGTEDGREVSAKPTASQFPESQFPEPTERSSHQYQSRSDLRFSIAVGIALALPVFIALSVYLMAALILVAEG
jgi:hypothetical protein